MPYDVKCYELAKAFGDDHGLHDAEIARLSQHIQDEIESEIDNILFFRKEPKVHG